ncbi:MAG TPA: DUF4956 domain-containing protein [Blastocatellia bacterium]|nr:DUF4956 domain-containing protein [Blastocatellia bacterium]
MEQKPNPETAVSVKTQILKLAAYFAVIGILILLARLLFEQLQGSPALAGFAKLNEVITESLDVTRKRDDSIITILALTLTLILVLPICWVYTVTKARGSFDAALTKIMIVMSLVVCGMMMLIQDNFSRALALVGAVSAVRFRTNLKDPNDAVYVLISIGIGMGTGLGVFHVATLLSLFLCVVYLLMWKFKVGEQHTSVAGFMEVKEKKKKKQKDKDKDKDTGTYRVSSQIQSEPLRAEAAQVEDETHLLIHLHQLAKLMEDKANRIKRPNAALLIRSLDVTRVEPILRATLESETPPWRLVYVAPGIDNTTFECLGRINGAEPPPRELMEQIVKRCAPSVVAVEFKSLKKAKDKQ